MVAGPVAAPPPAVTSFNTTFLNQPANGTWILRFQDGWSGDVGSVTAANLILLANFSTRTVTKVADTNDGTCDADCSLREAIAVAAPGDLVSFASPFFDTPRAIVLGGSELLIDKTLAIVGPGAHRLTISANNLSRIFSLNPGAAGRVTLSGMRLTDGNQGQGGAINMGTGSLVIHGCDISRNRSSSNGGGVFTASASAGLAIYDSSISGNSSSSQWGRHLCRRTGPNRLERVTLSGNSATIDGAALRADGDPVTLVACTVTGNRAGSDSVLTSIQTTVTLQNTVVADNGGLDLGTAGFPGGFASLGHNLIGNPGAVTVFTQPGDQTGTAPVRSIPNSAP